MTAGTARRAAATLLAGVALAAPLRAQSIDTLDLLAHARFLSLDQLEGRANGSRGQQLAAEYIEGELRRAGALPLFDGSYRQAVPLSRVVVSNDSRIALDAAGGRRTFVSAHRFHHLGGDSAAFRAFGGTMLDGGSTRQLAQAAPADARGAVVVANAGPGVDL